MKFLLPASLAILSGLTLAGCMDAMPGGGASAPAIGGNADDRALGVTLPLAPITPKDDHPKAQLQQMTGINADAVGAISGNADQSYIYFDPFSANRQAVPQAPARLCASYGKQLKSTRLTEPADREPGVKVLVVQCR